MRWKGQSFHGWATLKCTLVYSEIQKRRKRFIQHFMINNLIYFECVRVSEWRAEEVNSFKLFKCVESVLCLVNHMNRNGDVFHVIVRCSLCARLSNQLVFSSHLIVNAVIRSCKNHILSTKQVISFSFGSWNVCVFGAFLLLFFLPSVIWWDFELAKGTN